MATQPLPRTTMTSYGPAPTSLPTPSYDDPPQTGADPSYKPLPPGAQDSYKPNKDPGYDSSYRPLPLNQDVSLYKPTRQGSDPSYKPLPSSQEPSYKANDSKYDSSYRPLPPNQDPAYKPLPPSQEQSYKPNDATYDSSYRPLPSSQDPSYKPLPPSQEQPYKPTDPGYDPYRPRPSNQDTSLYKPSQSGPDPSYRPPLTSNDMAYHTLTDPQTFNSYGGPSYSGPGPTANITTSTTIAGYPPLNTLPAPDHPPSTEQMAGPAAPSGPPLATTTSLPLSITAKEVGIKHTLSSTESALREYMSMQRRRQSKTDDEQLRNQASTLLGDLHNLRQEVADQVKNAESHRWRRFLLGGAIASFIPIVKRLFPRPDREPETANDTEYAFRKSKSLISRVLEATRRPGIATVAFFVFAVLYVFQNEVSLRVGRTVTKRLKKLTSKVEAGEEVGEEDLKLLRGWRWRVLIWSE